jgi:hypothetical protein
MTLEGTVDACGRELLLVVERLSTQDKRRIVQLVELLRRAPAEVRKTSQLKLRRLLARESMTHAECQESINSVLAGIEQELVLRDIGLSDDEFPGPELGRAVSRV